MSECGSRAVLIVTTTPAGTATNVARRRTRLLCRLPADHPGLHRDPEQNEEWEGRGEETVMLVRHEDEES